MPPHPSNNSSGNGSDPWIGCYGIWPSTGGQGQYENGCYGHDEPGIQFYSTLPGSGGNVTWNVTLPVDGGPSANQSNLYSAIWFGLTLSDPFGWLDQCFLELQMYPDSSWGGAVNGEWVGAAVAWQIDAANGYEDTCFYEPLYGDALGDYLTMSDGDQLTINLTGWAGSPYGENISVTDTTSGGHSWTQLLDTTTNTPFNPAYSTQSVPNTLQWTPGGEYSATFAFETGHTNGYGGPNNNSYGGCSAGPPPPTPQDPAVPCPSYDPGSWLNNSRAPWVISTPVFRHGATTSTPSQVSFTEDLGGITFIDYISNGVCNGREGSAWCTAPWYSFSCGPNGFEFGATDYPGFTEDFGQYNEWPTYFAQDSAQLGYYFPRNFTIPTCGSPAATVTYGSTSPSSGQVTFLSTWAGAPVARSGVALGEYSLDAKPTPGYNFRSWSTTGALSVIDVYDPWTSLHVDGNGTVLATFTSSAVPQTQVTFDTSTGNGSVVVHQGFISNGSPPVGTFAAGSSVMLDPGYYAIQAYPPPGYNFSSWAVTSGNVTVQATPFIFTWINVSGAGGIASQAHLLARFTASLAMDTVYYGIYSGNGTVSLDDFSTFSSATLTLPVGTYYLNATPASGWYLATWYYSSAAAMTDFSASTRVTLEAGLTYYVDAYFLPAFTAASVRLLSTPANAGSIVIAGMDPLVSRTVSLVTGSYTTAAAANSGYYFTGWTVNSSSAAFVASSSSVETTLYLNSSVALTAHFAAGPAVNLSFSVNPAGAGQVYFDFQPYSDGSANTSLANGSYVVQATSVSGYAFNSFNLSGPLSLSGSILKVSGSGGHLTADYTPLNDIVTLEAWPSSVVLNVTLGGVTYPVGTTLSILSGDYPISANIIPGNAFSGWTVSPSLSISPSTAVNATLTIRGSGTASVLVAPFAVPSVRVSPATVDVGVPVDIRLVLNGTGGYTITWDHLPGDCGKRLSRANLTCIPSVAGTYNVTVSLSSVFGAQATSPPAIVVVNPAPSLSFLRASPAALTVGASTTFTLSEAGGTGPFTYGYFDLPAGCLSNSTTSLVCTPTGLGSFTITATVSDAFGLFGSVSTGLVVSAKPSIPAVAVSSAIVDVGVQMSFWINVSGGTAPFSLAYAGLPAGCTSANTSPLNCTPTAAGAFAVSGRAIDASGFAASAQATGVVVPPPHLVLATAGTGSAVVGAVVNISAVVADGAAPFHWMITGLPPGCAVPAGAANSTLQFDCVPNATGRYVLNVSATDRFGLAASRDVPLTISTISSSHNPFVEGVGPLSAVELWALIAAVAIAAIVSGALILRRRRASRAPPEPSPGSAMEEEASASDENWPSGEGPSP